MKYLLLLLGYGFLASCQNGKEVKHSFTEGTTVILADETFEPILEDELYVFKSSYEKADIKIVYKPETAVINDFLTGKSKIAVLSRLLTRKEKKVFEQNNVIIRVNKFALDAIALIVNNASLDTLIKLDEVIDVIKGKNERLQLVFDNSNSSTVRYIKDLAKIKDLPKKGVYALTNNNDVIKYVNNHQGSIGVVGINWLVQPEPDLEEKVKSVKILAIQGLQSVNTNKSYYKPNQTNLALGFYPLTRSIYIVNCEGGPGLGTGFASFLASDRGQRIVLKSGLLPDSIPSREILIKK